MLNATFCDLLINSGRVSCLSLLHVMELVIRIKKAAVRPLFIYFIVGIENSAPARRPVGQRAVMVFIRV